jgi:16S rRNA (guanine966-N2)-methyltransferase
LRIIRGTRRGKRISPPNNLPVRPTTDVAKEGLFNIIDNAWEMDGLRILDLFSGTGSISFEFASRGCAEIISLDLNPKCAEWVRKTASDLEFNNIYTIRADAFSYIKSPKEKFHIIFADPPYDLDNVETIPEFIFTNQLLTENGWLIVEHSANHDFTMHPRFLFKKNYGKVNFSFFGWAETSDEQV